MAKVVEFPGFDERIWREYRLGFSKMLTEAGVPDEGIAWVLAELKRRVLTAIPSFRASVPVPTLNDASPPQIDAATIAINAVEEHFRSLINGLVAQLFISLLELYMSQSNGLAPTLEMNAKIVQLIPGGKIGTDEVLLREGPNANPDKPNAVQDVKLRDPPPV